MDWVETESTTETEFDAKADADGNVSIVTVIDPSGERTQTYYDAIDRKIKEVDAKAMKPCIHTMASEIS